MPILESGRQPKAADTRFATRRARSGRWLFLPAGTLTALILTAPLVFSFLEHHREPDGLILHRVQRDHIQHTVVERGTIAAATSHEILCQVRGRSRGSSYSTSIQWIMEDGARVSKGDVIARLDSSGHEEDRKLWWIEVLKSQAEWVQSEENLKIVKSQTEGEIEAAEVQLKLADLDYRRYEEGEYKQKTRDLDGRISLAQADLDTWNDRIAWTQRMARLGFVSGQQARGEQLRLQGAEIALDRLNGESSLLANHTYSRMHTALVRRLKEAAESLSRTQDRARSKQIQAEVYRTSREMILKRRERRLRDLDEQVRNCTIYAPCDGMVSHCLPEQSRYGQGAEQSSLAQGEPVRFGQKLMDVPDLSRLVVVIKIHESVLAHIQGDQHQPTGFVDRLTVATQFSIDPWTSLIAAHAVDAFRDSFREYETCLARSGEPVVIELAGQPGRLLHGHVKHVAAIPSEREWRMSDQKLYTATVAIDDDLSGLYPGMTAVATILAQEPREQALVIPIDALFEEVLQGQTAQCLVRGSRGLEMREVCTGISNGVMVEILDGLSEGEDVVLYPASARGFGLDSNEDDDGGGMSRE